MACGHLRRLVVGPIGQAQRTFAAFSIFWVCFEPGADLFGLALQFLQLNLVLLAVLRLAALLCILLTVTRDDLVHRLLHLGGLTQEVGPRAALRFRGVARELHSVDGKHLAPNQTLPITDHQHLGEDLGRGIT